MTASHPMPGHPLRDRIAGSLRYAEDVDHLLMNGQARWTDALLSETRAQLSGCLNAVELMIGLDLGDHWLSRPVEALGPGYCRFAIERHPAVLAPTLLDHLRQRAAAALALRLAFQPPARMMDEPISSAVDFEAEAGPLADALTALRLSMDPWFTPHPSDRPMRADLAAEPYCDLVWTVAALLVDGLVSRMGVESAAATTAISRAAQAIIARHDEQSGPFARAAFAATLARDEADVYAIATEAALRRELLLLAALGGGQAGMTLDQALRLLIDGDAAERASLARLLSLDDAAYVALLEALAPLQGWGGDTMLFEYLDAYRSLTASAAIEKLARWGGPAALAEKLSHITWAQQ